LQARAKEEEYRRLFRKFGTATEFEHAVWETYNQFEEWERTLVLKAKFNEPMTAEERFGYWDFLIACRADCDI
jgi:hypothetical protein